jgi:predicted nucleic acid-binding protein
LRRSLLRLPLLTSTAVLTDAFHLVGDSKRERAALWAFIRSGAVRVGEIADADLPALDILMAKYADRPMDFADATLVHLAEREGLTDVFTIDHDDFETYRIAGRRRFRTAPLASGPRAEGARRLGYSERRKATSASAVCVRRPIWNRSL